MNETYHWILHVFADIRKFAQENNLPRIASTAEMAMNTAQDELVEKGRKCREPFLTIVNGETRNLKD